MAKKRRENKKRWFEIAGPVVGVAVVLLLLLQAILGLIGKKPPSGENYYGQPIDPILQLVMVGVVAACFVLWLVFRKKKNNSDNQRKDRSSRKPFLPGAVPDRWPWQ